MSTLGTLQVSPLSFEQANPFLTGLQQGQQVGTNNLQQNLLAQQARGQQLKNQYLPQEWQQNILAKQYANQLAGANAQNANALAAAGLLKAQTDPLLTQAQANYANANATNVGAQTNRYTQETPYDVNKARYGQYSNPAYSNAAQVSDIGGYGPNGQRNVLQAWHALPNIPSAYDTPPQNVQAPYAAAPDMPQKSSNPITSGSPAPQSNLTVQPQQYGQVNQALQAASGQSPGITPKLFSGDTSQNIGVLNSPYSPGQIEQQKEAAKQGVIQYQNAMKDANKEADNGNALSRQLDSFRNKYQQATYKGPFLGSFPSSGFITGAYGGIGGNLAPEQTLDSLAANLKAEVGKQAVGGRVTQQQAADWIEKMKPGRTMSEGTMNDMVNMLQSVAVRSGEQPAFIDTAVKNGIDPKTAQALFIKYDQERPPFDSKTMQPLTGNLKSWTPYISKEALDAYHGSKPFMPNDPSQSQMVTVQGPNGQGRIPAEKLDQFLKDYPDHKRVG